MSELPFEMPFVPHTYGVRAARQAVLVPLYRYPKNDAQVKELVGRTWRLWNAALVNIERTAVSLGARELANAKACRGGLCLCLPKVLKCRLWHICPFCYAEAVKREWASIRSAIRQLLAEKRAFKIVEMHDHALVGYTNRGIISRKSYGLIPPPSPFRMRRFSPLPLGTLQQLAMDLRASLSEYKRRQFDFELGKPLASYASIVVEPWPTCWHVQFRRLLLVPDPWPREGWMVARKMLTRPGTMREAARALGRVSRYPKFMLRADPNYFAAQIAGTTGLRLTENFGLFRGQKD